MKPAVRGILILLACPFGAAAQSPVITSVVNQASSTTPVSPGMPVAIRGSNFSDRTVNCPGPRVPMSCGSLVVTVNGQAAPVRLVTPAEIIAYIPIFQVAGQATVFVRTAAGLPSNNFNVTVDAYAPGIQLYNDAGQVYAYVSDQAQRAVTRSNPAVPGQEFILYATGLGPTNPVVVEGVMGIAFAVLPPELYLDNRLLPLISVTLGCGVLCEPGNYLVRFILPIDVAPGDHQVSLQIGARRSNAATLVVGFPTSAPSLGYVQNPFDARVRTLSPGSLLSVVGGGFAPAGPISNCFTDPNVWPTQCQGLRVTVNGLSAPIQLITPNFINIQVPFEVSPGPATLVVERTAGGQTLRSNPLNVTVDNYSPALSANPASPYPTVLVLTTAAPASAANPIVPGDVIHILLTGLGQTNPPMVTGFGLTQTARTLTAPSVTIGGKPLEDVFAEALPPMTCQYRISARAPAGLGNGDQPIVVEIGGKRSQAGLLVPVSSQTAIGAVTNSASGLPEIAAGSWVSLYGRNFSANRREWNEADIVYDWLPAALDGVSVSIGGKPSAVSFISPTQVNVLASESLPPGPAEVTVNGPFGWQRSTVLVKQFAPGFFSLQIPPGVYLAALHPDWSYVARPGLLPPHVPSRPARPGETIILYGTGFGPTNPPVSNQKRFTGAAPLAGPVLPRVQFGPAVAQVDFAGLVGNGLYQFNLVVPNVPDGDHEVVVSMGGETSPRGRLITVQR